MSKAYYMIEWSVYFYALDACGVCLDGCLHTHPAPAHAYIHTAGKRDWLPALLQQLAKVGATIRSAGSSDTPRSSFFGSRDRP